MGFCGKNGRNLLTGQNISACIFHVCLGYEDLNDHKTLRADPAIVTAATFAIDLIFIFPIPIFIHKINIMTKD